MGYSTSCKLTVNLVLLLQGLWITIHASAMIRTERSVRSCPPEWDEFGNKCYRMFGEETYQRETWDGANRKCGEIESTMVSIHSEEEQDFVKRYVSEVNNDIWIGLRLDQTQNVFRWTDNSALDFTNWELGEPNSYNNEEDCAHMNLKDNVLGSWNDHRCSRVFPYICQIPSSGCGGNFVSEQGTISSPNFPQKYGSNANCIWKITVPDGYQVLLKFKSFETEEGYLCNYDYVKIRDGHESNSAVLGKFCGSQVPNDLISSGNKMSIEFRSDLSYHFGGFTAEFTKDTPALRELENFINQLPDILVRQKVEKLKKKKKLSPRKKAFLRTLEEQIMKR